MQSGEPEKWDTERVARYLGVAPKTVSSYHARRQMPVADGQYRPLRPWWWSTTITHWQANRPGQGVGGGIKPKKPRA